MLQKLNSLLVLLLFSSLVFAQKDEVLLTINGKKIFRKEFIEAYQKSSYTQYNSKDSLEKFLDTYIDFKLKVFEAESLGLKLTDEYKTQMEAFHKEFAGQYLIDKQLIENEVERCYERSRTEVWIKQILLRLAPNASDADSLFTYQKAMSIRKKLINGANFAQIAAQVSDDPTAALNGGDLWYVKPLMVPREVENYIYGKNSERFSPPIRTIYGYHIIDIVNKRTSPGRFKVAHILIANPKDTGELAEKLVKQKADSIYQLSINGEDFGLLAQKYSADNGTSANGGELPWFETGKMPREFELEVLKLKTNGSISRPVRTKYGWHIIKIISHEEDPSFEQIKQQIYNLILESDRSITARKKFVEKLKNEYRFRNSGSKSLFYNLIDSTIFEGKWEIPFLTDLDEVLFTFDNQTIYQKDFAKYLERNQKQSYPVPVINFVNSKYDEFVDKTILDYESGNIEKKYPEFSDKMNDFREKLLADMFMEKFVWQKSKTDNQGLKDFYQKNSSNYNKLYSANVCIYSYTTEKTGKIEKFYKKTSDLNLTGSELEKYMRDFVDGEFELKKCGEFEEGQDLITDQCILFFRNGKLKNDQKLIFFDDKNLLVLLNNEIKIRIKPFEEVKEKVAPDYQSYLEKDLMSDLKRRYNVSINQAIFDSILY